MNNFDDIPARYPIIYVRGFAFSKGEQDDTSADPFHGFNLGSTVYRAAAEKTARARKFVFESPVVRLMSDFGYSNVYRNGFDLQSPEWEDAQPQRSENAQPQHWIEPHSIIVYPYYEAGSNLLGNGETPSMEDFARGLSALVARVRKRVCDPQKPTDKIAPEAFKCYLVAHSMGGLICRAFLQNPKLDPEGVASCVDKVFTYATPHNGIEIAGVNVPDWLRMGDVNNFSRKRMAKYLNLEKIFDKTDRVDYLPEERFPSSRFFCMIGTNRADYEVLMGLSRTFVGQGSDGLVRIENASIWGVNDKGEESEPGPKAFTFRAHSGHFGIVNSEEAYQNLTRFLFGDLRVDLWLDIESVTLPQKLQDKSKVNALYQIEVLAGPRGKRWNLTRRISEEDSVACRTHAEITDGKDPGRKRIHLSTIFLAKRARVDVHRPTLAYAVTLGVRVPDYEVDHKLWFDEHYEGGYLFRETFIFEVTMPDDKAKTDWKVECSQLGQPEQVKSVLAIQPVNDGAAFECGVPVVNAQAPGIRATLRLHASLWNKKA